MCEVSRSYSYPLEQLYSDQEPDFVHDTVAPLISWLDPNGQEFSRCFELREYRPGGAIDHQLTVSWNLDRLMDHRASIVDDVRRYRAKRTVAVEKQPEFAAYGLALVAVSCLLKRRVVHISYWEPPDLLLDRTPGKLRGVEVAGRTSGGYPALNRVLNGACDNTGKLVQLRERSNIIEAYLSLWCCVPTVSVWIKVKP